MFKRTKFSRNHPIPRKNLSVDSVTPPDSPRFQGFKYEQDIITKIKRIDQIPVGRRLSSFAWKKHDPLHTHILDLVFDDPVTDMPDYVRRGLANNVHFLIMRDMHQAVVDNAVEAKNIYLQYQWDFLEKRHRTIVRVTKTMEESDESEDWIIIGEWVTNRRQALESLRRKIEEAAYTWRWRRGSRKRLQT